MKKERKFKQVPLSEDPMKRNRGGLRLFWIKNKHIYQPKNKQEANQEHLYGVYKDPKSGEVRAIQMTHIYDPKRVRDLEKGKITVVKFAPEDYPSGSRYKYYVKDQSGALLDLKKINAKEVQYKSGKPYTVPAALAKKIKRFARIKIT